MQKLEIKLKDKINCNNNDKENIEEIIKKLSFISKDILEFEIKEQIIIIYCENDADINKIEKRIYDLIDNLSNNINNSEEIYFQNIVKRSYTSTDDIMSEKYVINFGEGSIGLSGKALELFEYFDNTFKGFALELGGIEEKYPVLLSNKTLKDTGYLRTSPQYIHYINSIEEDVDILCDLWKYESAEEFYSDSVGVLSPSACFHVYERYRNSLLEQCKTVTLLQSVFRNEGRFNWKEYGRLRDYHVREIVFIGSENYVRESLTLLMDKTSKFIRNTGFTGEIKTASDPFVIPDMQKYKLLQLKNKVKYEVKLNYSESRQMSVASFNFHGKSFTYPFNIKVENETETVTGCVGYGLERWVLAYLSQFGNKS